MKKLLLLFAAIPLLALAHAGSVALQARCQPHESARIARPLPLVLSEIKGEKGFLRSVKNLPACRLEADFDRLSEEVVEHYLEWDVAVFPDDCGGTLLRLSRVLALLDQCREERGLRRWKQVRKLRAEIANQDRDAKPFELSLAR